MWAQLEVLEACRLACTCGRLVSSLLSLIRAHLITLAKLSMNANSSPSSLAVAIFAEAIRIARGPTHVAIVCQGSYPGPTRLCRGLTATSSGSPRCQVVEMQAGTTKYGLASMRLTGVQDVRARARKTLIVV